MAKLEIKTIQSIEGRVWDGVIEEIYGRPYCLQQQDGCKTHGTLEHITVPCDPKDYDYENDTIPEVMNGEEMGVSFAAWLARDPKQGPPEDLELFCELFWYRNFYPALDVIAQDLHVRGLLPAGDYQIVV